MQQVKLSESTAARRRIPLSLVDDTDGDAATGLTIGTTEIKISKNGAAEGNSAGTVAELAGGLYYYEATAGELDTFGFLTARVAKTGVAPFTALVQIVAQDAYDAVRAGLTALPNAAAGANGGLPTGNASAQVSLNLTQAVPTTNTAETVGDALNAARAQGFGKWVISGTTLTLYANDGSTAVRTFTLNDAVVPTSRT